MLTIQCAGLGVHSQLLLFRRSHLHQGKQLGLALSRADAGRDYVCHVPVALLPVHAVRVAQVLGVAGSSDGGRGGGAGHCVPEQDDDLADGGGAQRGRRVSGGFAQTGPVVHGDYRAESVAVFVWPGGAAFLDQAARDYQYVDLTRNQRQGTANRSSGSDLVPVDDDRHGLHAVQRVPAAIPQQQHDGLRNVPQLLHHGGGGRAGPAGGRLDGQPALRRAQGHAGHLDDADGRAAVLLHGGHDAEHAAGVLGARVVHADDHVRRAVRVHAGGVPGAQPRDGHGNRQLLEPDSRVVCADYRDLWGVECRGADICGGRVDVGGVCGDVFVAD